MDAHEVIPGQTFKAVKTGAEFVRVQPKDTQPHGSAISVRPAGEPDSMVLHIDNYEPVELTANANCLAGMKCPKCGSLGPFEIQVRAWATMHDDGAEEYVEPDWENGDHCRCLGCDCDYRGSVSCFKEDA